MEFSDLSWVLIVLNFIAIVLNNRRDYRCFYIFIVTNILWCIFDVYYGLYSQAAQFILYTILNFVGLKSWKKKENI